MKIAIFSDCYLDLTGGIVTAIDAEKKELEARGHTVYIFTSAFPRGKKELEKLASSHIFPVKSCRVFGRKLTPIARRPRVIERQLEKDHPELKNFDIFYIHYEAGCSIAGIRLARHYHIPVVQFMHGREDVGEENIIPVGLRTLVATALNLFHSWYLPHPVKIHRDDYLATTTARAKMWTLMVNHANSADLVLTPSEHFRKKLQHYGVTRRVSVLPHGVDDALFKEKPNVRTLAKNQPLKIIWHSRLSGEKRPLEFLQALALLKDPSKYHLLVYGDGPELKKAKHFASKHHLKITFYGNKKFPVIWQAMKNAHLDVLCSYDFDTYGMTLAEAEVADLPVLIVDKDLTEIVPKGSFILSSSPSPEDMAKSLEYLLAHPEQITKMSKIMLDARTEKRNSGKITTLEKIIKNLK